jgi:cell division protein FtsB
MGISRKAKKEIFWIIFILFLTLQCYILVFADGGYLQYKSLAAELEELKRENMTLRQNQKQLLEEIEKMKNDPTAIERKARETIDVAKPGDIIVNIGE